MIATAANCLIDTNILLYAYDRNEPVKQRRATQLLDALAHARSGVVSTQVLGEFFVVATHRLRFPLPRRDAVERLLHFMTVWDLVLVSRAIIMEAWRGVSEHGFSYWDAQMWATARLNQIPVILSEDFSAGSTVEGVQFLNPFASDFRFETLP